jgi:HAD superfamily hydrolase (TIGR01490 family)
MASTEQPTPQIVAFFDIDNTIMRGASIFHLARGLFSRKFLTVSDITKYGAAQGKFLLAGKENIQDMARITENALAFVAGRNVSEVMALADEIYDENMESKVWPGTIELARGHLASGHQVWLVSAAPIELADLIARKLGFTGALATVSEVVEGTYTGKLVSKPMHGPEKAAAIERLAISMEIDLANCFAYSDSINDIPLLTKVGNPRAVNPDSHLRNFAKLANWPIHDYRRQRIVKRYVIPAGITTLALVGTRAGLAINSSRKSENSR